MADKIIPALDPEPTDAEYNLALDIMAGNDLAGRQEVMAESRKIAAYRVAAHRAGIEWAANQVGPFLRVTRQNSSQLSATDKLNWLLATHDAAMHEAQGENEVIDG